MRYLGNLAQNLGKDRERRERHVSPWVVSSVVRGRQRCQKYFTL